jgi:PAS domain S-box-containing protein
MNTARPTPTGTDEGAALLNALLQHGPYMVIAIDEGYRILSINRVVKGLCAQDVIGTSALDYMPPEHHAKVRSAIDEVLSTGVPGRFETGGLVADGSFGWWVTQVLPVTGEPGAARALLLTTDITAAKRAEEALRASEERLRYALEAAEEGLWDWNLVSGACYFSPAYDTMLGYPPGAISRSLSGVQALMHPDEADLQKQGPGLLRDPGHFVLRFRLRHADGEFRWIESRGKTVQRDAQGQPLRAVGTHVDITERLRLEQALKQSEAQLRALVESTTDAIFIKDLQGRYLLVNQPALKDGSSVTDTLGRDDSAFLPAEIARQIMALDRRVMDEGRVITIQETLELVEGHPRTFLTTKGPLRDDSGQVVGLFGIARDVTELLRKEEAQRQALQDSRDLLDMALAGGELGTWDTDLTTGGSLFDERYLAMIGYRPGELAPTMQAWLQLIHPDDRAAVDEAVEAHARGETRVCEFEHRLRHRDGHWVWVLARGKMLRDASGRPIRAVGTHLDITDRKRAATEGAQLLRKIEELLGGLEPRRNADSALRSTLATVPDHLSAVAVLSARQREVLALLAEGLTAAEVAARLGISPETASTHRRDLMRKLGLRNKAELIRYALEHEIRSAPTNLQRG